MPLVQFIDTATTTAKRVEFPGPIRQIVITVDGTDAVKVRTDGRLAENTLPGISPGQTLELFDLFDRSLSYVTNSADSQIRVWCVWNRE